MTVSSTVTRVTYTGDGQTIAFPTTFPFFGASEIEVIERNIATGAETVKTLTTHYTVLGGNGATGTVTAALGAPSSSVQWIIRRKTARTQEIDYTPNDPFPAETHEQGLDRLKMNVQELGEENDRALKFPKSDAIGLASAIPSSVARAGKFLTFDGNGVPTVSAGSADGLAVSPFMAALLDDTDAPTARATLGISSTGLDITGMAAVTTPAINDELPIYDLSALANRKITVLDLFKAVSTLTAESAPAIDDELVLYDTSAGVTDKITLANMLKVINGLTEDTTPDAANDFVVTYDASAGAAKKVKPSNLSAGGIGGMSVQVFTGSGTWTRPTGVKYVHVICVGGGGGGSGVTSGESGSRGGGGGGGYCEKIIDVQAISSETVTVGSAGSAGVATGGNGGAGGSTSFGTHLSAGGGDGGTNPGSGSGGAGGSGSGGNINIAGQAGRNGANPSTHVNSGEGGNSPRGYGHGGVPSATTGNAGIGYGAGGSSGIGDSTTLRAGGAGTAGICIVYEFK